MSLDTSPIHYNKMKSKLLKDKVKGLKRKLRGKLDKLNLSITPSIRYKRHQEQKKKKKKKTDKLDNMIVKIYASKDSVNRIKRHSQNMKKYL